MKKNLFLILLLAVALPFGFSACSSDDDDNNGKGTEQEEEDDNTASDGLAYFQSAITQEDSNQNLLYYHYGEDLYNNEHLYIGADTWDECKKTFGYWIPGDKSLAKVSEGDDEVKAELRDEQGNTQLTVYLKKGTNASVAEVTVSDESKIRHFTQISFVLNSTWPFNSGDNQWEVGDIVENLTLTSSNKVENYLDEKDKTLSFVCIREASNGTKPMFIACTKTDYACGYKTSNPNSHYYVRYSGYAPSSSTAETITSLMKDDWDTIEKALSKADCGEFSGSTDYWIDDKGTGTWYAYQYKSGTKTGYSKGTELRFLLCIDDLKDSEVKANSTVKVTSH